MADIGSPYILTADSFITAETPSICHLHCAPSSRPDFCRLSGRSPPSSFSLHVEDDPFETRLIIRVCKWKSFYLVLYLLYTGSTETGCLHASNRKQQLTIRSKTQKQKHKSWPSLMSQSLSKMLNTATKPWVCFLASQEKITHLA